MLPKLVIFDCDGVLVDSERLSNATLQASLAFYGLNLPVDEITHMFVGGTMASVHTEVARRGVTLPENWVEIINKEVATELAAKVEIIANVPSMLDQLDASGILYAVGSNGPMGKMQVTLGRTGLWDRMQGRIYTAHDCAAQKPAPDVYLKVAALAGIKADDCVVIEDSASGARAAVAANMRCFGYCADTDVEKLRPHCEVTFNDMAQLPELLGLK